MKFFFVFRKILEQINYRIKLKRIYLIEQLKSIYSIESTGTPDLYSINGITLANSDFTGADEEQSAMALGFVGHLVFMISKYLDVNTIFLQFHSELEILKLFLLESLTISIESNGFKVNNS